MQTDAEVEKRKLALRDAFPEKLRRTPGPRAMLRFAKQNVLSGQLPSQSRNVVYWPARLSETVGLPVLT
jgi:hypothetical protein